MIGNRDQFLDAINRLDARKDIWPGRAPENPDVDTERLGPLGDCAADRAETGNPDRLAGERAQRTDLPLLAAARPDVMDALLEAENRRKDVFRDRISRDAAADRDHGTVEQPRRKEIDSRRCGLDPVQAKRPAGRLLRRRLVPAHERPRQQHVGFGSNLPGRAIGGMIDDQRARPVIDQRRTNVRAKLIDDDRRSHAGGGALVFNSGSVHVTQSRWQRSGYARRLRQDSPFKDDGCLATRGRRASARQKDLSLEPWRLCGGSRPTRQRLEPEPC
ncbi:hypothetical protein ACVW0J_007415 [Bradyrhizobium sp. i1.7.7]